MAQPIRLLSDDPRALDALRRIEILYTDLDGTLLARGGRLLADAAGAPSAVTAQAIVELNRVGLTVVPVTGRSRLQLTEVCRLLGWTDFIAEIGGVIVHGVGTPDREITYNLGTWDPAAVPAGRTPLEHIGDLGALDVLQRAFPGQLEPHAPWHEGREVAHLLRGCVNEAAGQAVLDAQGIEVDLVDNGQIHPPIHGLACEDHIHAFHLVPHGVDKCQAIALDLKARGLTPDQAMAVGDSAADIRMGSSVGLVALVANAMDSPVTRAAIDRHPDVRLLSAARGEGWAELARLWIESRTRN